MSSGVVFMSHPSEVLKAYLRTGHQKMSPWKAGRLSMALEVLTQMKILEQLPMTDLSTHLIAALQALLVDQQLLDEAERWYEKLDAWRVPRFEASGPDRGISQRGVLASQPASREGALARSRKMHEEQRARRDPDADAMPSSEEPDASGA